MENKSDNLVFRVTLRGLNFAVAQLVHEVDHDTSNKELVEFAMIELQRKGWATIQKETETVCVEQQFDYPVAL